MTEDIKPAKEGFFAKHGATIRDVGIAAIAVTAIVVCRVISKRQPVVIAAEAENTVDEGLDQPVAD